ncbi:MAG TPA: DUF3788 family protein [Ignavibacteria bacterium]|nr:DUF3788 family protein [Ignavibacteria bacterium]
MQSIFMNKGKKPGEAELKTALSKTFPYWKTLEEFTLKTEPAAKGDWYFSGAKFGWSYRISDKKRVIIYLLPRDGFFKAAFVFGRKAYEEIMASDISDEIKNELKAAKPYAEGRGIRLEVKSKTMVSNIRKLVKIKIEN